MRIIILFLGCCLISCSGSSSSNEEGDLQDLPEVKFEKPIVETVYRKEVPNGRCDISVVVLTSEKLESLIQDDIYKFLYTFSDVCENNVEFGEFGNEVLFQVVSLYPKLVSDALLNDSIDSDQVFKELANPVIEIEEPMKVIEGIEVLNISKESKEKIIESFKKNLGIM